MGVRSNGLPTGLAWNAMLAPVMQINLWIYAGRYLEILETLNPVKYGSCQ
jgi:hypothetical protein